jgi:hypothetical protein
MKPLKPLNSLRVFDFLCIFSVISVLCGLISWKRIEFEKEANNNLVKLNT